MYMDIEQVSSVEVEEKPEVEFRILRAKEKVKYGMKRGEYYLVFKTTHGLMHEEDVARKVNLTITGFRSRCHRLRFDFNNPELYMVRKSQTVWSDVEEPSIEQFILTDTGAPEELKETPYRPDDDDESISMYDHFAIAAMNALIIKGEVEHFYLPNIAIMSFDMADAMMEQRKLYASRKN